ncbi:DUF1800 domain-containing protein [Massilia sp. R2A-15]|uniref:DUF1800 domain-containing protein n=1 Tax=Massilia sp. R2A-15 TaxID=3064278 RepID=UPI0027368D2D|nr:DUF1800 domain-containing protein [Massilia sp. R2A-15]WLI88210.1 DUF1800 domain-containing protein [Massilia sp. R2A-15]
MKTQRLSLFLFSALVWAAAPAGAQTLTPDQQAVHVLNRLAFGPKPGDIERVRQIGVERYIDEQLHPETIPMPAALTERLASLAAVNRKAGDVVDQFVDLQKQVRVEDEGAKQKRRLALTAIAMETAEARLLRAIDSPRQLEEVMVDFWYNHFNVFSGKGIDRALVASYERDAIRPYVLGSFRDMLGATAKHPAMLYYLDNNLSTVAGYTPGRVRAALALTPKGKASGLNENFAREIMELHTLGVDGGYTQKDVTELARMLTGWGYDQRTLMLSNQTFRFDLARHDKGVKHWLGREVKSEGLAEGEMALDVLAMHPSTAHHISYKLAQYFVQDEPPPALVERMARMYMASKGDIRSVLRTLFSSQQFMAPEAVGAKFKTPYQFVISAARASGAPVTNIQPLLGTMTQLGMPLYGCLTPDGYKNTQEAWLNPDALTRRITFATALAGGKLPLSKTPAMSAPAAPELDATQLQATLGGAISSRTLSTVAGNAEPLRAAMLLGSPDFMQH